MVEIDDKLISLEVFEKQFVCDLAACKGACCVEGSGGAPLDEHEIELLEKNYETAKKYLSPQSVEEIEKQGFYVVGSDRELETPLINGEECVYVYYDENDIAKCAYDTAFRNGESEWLKPTSCQLYPIRLSKLSSHIAINYHKWHICEPACRCGTELKIPVFRFLKEPIIRKFGQEFYESLLEAEKLVSKKQ